MCLTQGESCLYFPLPMSKMKKRRWLQWSAFWLILKGCSWILWTLKNWCPVRHPSGQKAREKLLKISHQGNTNRSKGWYMRKMDTNKCWWGQEGTGLLIHSSWEQAHTPFLHMYVFAVCAFAHAYSVHIHICVNVRRPEGDGNLPLSLFHPTLWDRVSRSSLGLVVLTSLTSQLTQGLVLF